MRLSGRVAALEQREPRDYKSWHRVLQYADQTEEEAIAVYEAEHGPIPEDDSLIVRIMKPGRVPDAA